MKILAIESSCDDTSVAIVEDGRRCLAMVSATSLKKHANTGGIVPEVAAREHAVSIIPCLEACMKECGVTEQDIDAIAVTTNPGLVGSLLIGVNTARVLAEVWGKKLIEVNHIEGHVYGNWLGEQDPPSFPFVVLTASGGHNELQVWTDHNTFETAGKTRDDAGGEAFDKVSRMLGLGFPGGPVISKRALEGDAGRFDFPRPMINQKNFDFSFSGLKTAVLNVVRDFGGSEKMSEQDINDVCASFQQAVVDVLLSKLTKLAEERGIEDVLIAGGVSANTHLRESLENWAKKSGERKLHSPDFKFCVDNAAMIGARSFYMN